MEQDLRDMNDKELFLVTTGTYGVVLKARLQNIVKQYLRHEGKSRLEDSGDALSEIVRNYYEGRYDD